MSGEGKSVLKPTGQQPRARPKASCQDPQHKNTRAPLCHPPGPRHEGDPPRSERDSSQHYPVTGVPADTAPKCREPQECVFSPDNRTGHRLPRCSQRLNDEATSVRGPAVTGSGDHQDSHCHALLQGVPPRVIPSSPT